MRARARATRPTSRSPAPTSRSPRNAPSTSRPACRAASRTRWRRCCGRAGPRRCSSTAARSTSSTSPIPPELCVLVVHSGVARTLEASPYAQRRAESEAVAAELGLRVLRDAVVRTGARPPTRPPRGHRDGRASASSHEALRADDLDALGPLMLASHASSRDDMEVSIPELDVLVECLVDAGAYGARLTGAGFGGCVVAIGPAERRRAIADARRATYRARTGLGADGVGRARRRPARGRDRLTRRGYTPALEPEQPRAPWRRGRNEPSQLLGLEAGNRRCRSRTGRARPGRCRSAWTRPASRPRRPRPRTARCPTTATGPPIARNSDERDRADEDREHPDDADAGVRHQVLAPRALEQLARALHRGDRTEALEHEHRQDEERHDRPRHARRWLPMMRPKMPPRCSTARSTTETVALTSAHGSSTCDRSTDGVDRVADRRPVRPGNGGSRRTPARR